MRKQLLAVLIAGEISAAVLAWRELDRRPDSAIRGSKKVWLHRDARQSRQFACLMATRPTLRHQQRQCGTTGRDLEM